MDSIVSVQIFEQQKKGPPLQRKDVEKKSQCAYNVFM